MLTFLSAHLQMSKKALMERVKEDRKKSDTGEKAKGKPKVRLCVMWYTCCCHLICDARHSYSIV